MRKSLTLLVLCLLPGCSDAPAPDAGLRERQESSCALAIAAHVSRPVSEVDPRWLSEQGDIAQVETIDGTRRHICEVDGAARVLGYRHPGA